MLAEEPAGRGWTRRAMLCCLATLRLRAGSEGGQWFSSDRVRLLDPATDFPLLRLTSPAYSSHFSASHLRAVSRSGAFLLFSSDRTGSWQVFRLEQSSGRQQLLTQARALDGASPALMPDDRSFCYLDGGSLHRFNLVKPRDKEIYRVPEGWKRSGGLSLSRDGSQAVLVEARGGVFRLRLVKTSSGKATTVLERAAVLSDPVLRSRRERLLYRQETDSLWAVGLDGRQNRSLPLAPGGLGSVIWSPDGASIFYLRRPPDGRLPAEVREHRLQGGADQLVAATSRFQVFSANRDASVFVGASASRASPYVLLLLHATRREMALCEHGASDPARVDPVFSPDSQWVYFESDREGKWAIYCAPVDRFVERT